MDGGRRGQRSGGEEPTHLASTSWCTQRLGMRVYFILDGNLIKFEKDINISLSRYSEPVAEAGQGVVGGTAVVGPQVANSGDATS